MVFMLILKARHDLERETDEEKSTEKVKDTELLIGGENETYSPVLVPSLIS